MPKYEVAKNIRLYCEDFGEGKAVVFTSAGIQTRKMWEHQAAELSFKYRIITYDWRGTGRSDRPRGTYSVDQAVEDLCELVDSLSIM